MEFLYHPKDRLFAFLDLPVTDQQIAAIAAANDFDEYRRSGNGSDHFRGAVGSWSEVFSEADLDLIQREAGTVLEAAGY